MGLLHVNFLSETLGYHTNIYAVFPACTHEGKEPKATLYLLHGGAGNAMDWIRYTSIERYADENEIAVIMPEVDGDCFYADMKYGYPYYTFLTGEVVNVAEALFPINKEASKRMVAGLSMGGYGAFKWAFLQPDAFFAAANLSGFSFVTEIFSGDDGFAKEELTKENGVITLDWGSMEELAGSINDTKEWVDLAVRNKVQLPRLYAGIGTEDFSYEFGKRFVAYCKEKGIKIQYEEMPGKHEWMVWDVLIQKFIKWALEE